MTQAAAERTAHALDGAGSPTASPGRPNRRRRAPPGRGVVVPSWPSPSRDIGRRTTTDAGRAAACRPGHGAGLRRPRRAARRLPRRRRDRHHLGRPGRRVAMVMAGVVVLAVAELLRWMACPIRPTRSRSSWSGPTTSASSAAARWSTVCREPRSASSCSRRPDGPVAGRRRARGPQGDLVGRWETGWLGKGSVRPYAGRRAVTPGLGRSKGWGTCGGCPRTLPPGCGRREGQRGDDMTLAAFSGERVAGVRRAPMLHARGRARESVMGRACAPPARGCAASAPPHRLPPAPPRRSTHTQRPDHRHLHSPVLSQSQREPEPAVLAGGSASLPYDASPLPARLAPWVIPRIIGVSPSASPQQHQGGDTSES